LNFLHVQKLRAEFESQWKLVTQNLSVLLDLIGMAVFKLTKSLSILLLSLKQVLIPLLIELLVLLDVSLLTLLSLLSLVEYQLLVSSVIILLLKLSDSILGHFGFNIFAFTLACVPVVFKDLTTSQ